MIIKKEVKEVESWGVGVRPIYELDDLYVKEIITEATFKQIDNDTQIREAIVLYASPTNRSIIFIGTSSSTDYWYDAYHLEPNYSLVLRRCSLSKIYCRSLWPGERLYVIAGGI